MEDIDLDFEALSEMFYKCTAYPTPEKSRTSTMGELFGQSASALTLKDLVAERLKMPLRGFCYNCKKDSEYYKVEGKKQRVGYTTESVGIRVCPRCHYSMYWTRKWRKL